MKTIKETITHELIIKNSRFITILFPLSNNNINSILNNVKEEYPKATHYCYAYIYGNDKGCSDDGEPSRTAGFPMLNVLEKEEFNNILAVTIRYFGGIKLGAGGLVRAYTKSITESLKDIELLELTEGYKIEIEFPYSEEKQINYLLGNSTIINKEYKENTIYTVLIEKDLLNKLSNYTYSIIEECYIKKDSH